MNLEKYLRRLPPFLLNPRPDIYESNNYVVLDFETTNKDRGSASNLENRIIFSCWKTGSGHPDYQVRKGGLFYSRGSEYELHGLVHAIEAADFVVAHNSKFELGWLRRCGLDIDNVLPFCTQIAEYCIAGNRQWGRMSSLEECLQRRDLGGKDTVVSKLIKAGVCPSEIPKRWLEDYGTIDVVQTEKLFLSQRKLACKNGLLPLMFTRNIFTVPLMSMEDKGSCVDPKRVGAVNFYLQKRKQELEKRFDEITGGANVKSTIQMRKVLYEDLGFTPPKDYRGQTIVTPGGDPRTDAKTLAKLKATNKTQKEFIALKAELTKIEDALSKLILKLRDMNISGETIIHFNYIQTKTATHRLASQGKEYKIQGQNWPNEYKPLITTRHEGWSIGEIDEAQLEYRIAVHLGRDEVGLRDILNDVDSHAFTASIIFETEWKKVGEDLGSSRRTSLRKQSKAHTFKPLYGGKSGTPRERKYYEAFRAKHKGITQTQDGWVSEVLRNGFLKTATGLRFYWPDTRVTQSGYITNSTNICNYPVQSFATADIVPIAVTYQYHLMRIANMESFLINTVHDSSIGEVHPEERELFEELGVYCMVDKATEYCKQVFNIELFAPLEAEVEFKSHWSDSQEWREKYGN